MIYVNSIKILVYYTYKMSSFNEKQTNNLIVDPEFPYEPPCMRCQPIINNACLQFHGKSIPVPIKLFNDTDDYNFGILNINIRNEIPVTNKHIHVVFTIDASGSMNNRCSDGKTKMDHIHHTLSNMLRMFYENSDCNISIHVQSFDTSVQTVISNVSNIHEADLEQLLSLIHKIRPGNETNIEIALKKAIEEIVNYNDKNPEHEIVHLFLTDGEITSGETDYDKLLELVPNKCSNIFIGYGQKHDSELLSYLSQNKGNEYRFIDALDKAGLVYGEVIHGILYKAIEDVSLRTKEGEIYDYATNTWSQCVEIGNLLSDQLKTYHVRSKNMDECSVEIYGKTIVKTKQFQKINKYEQQLSVQKFAFMEDKNNLGVYMYRQRTQELLYEARHISSNYRKSKIFHSVDKFDEIMDTQPNTYDLREQKTQLKQKFVEFHKNITEYMKTNGLEEDPLMKMLCDDIYITYKTMGTSMGSMYSCARQTSNGRQQSYMCTTIEPELPFGRLRLRRGQAMDLNSSIIGDIGIGNLEQDDLDNYTPSQNFLSPFTTNSVVTVMRDVSGNHSIGKKDDIATVSII